MELKEALIEIQSTKGDFPQEALGVIRARKEEAIPELIEIVKAPLEDLENIYSAGSPAIAILLLSEFEVKDAFEYMLDYMRLDDDECDMLLGDALTECMHMVLANTAGENGVKELKKLTENNRCGEFQRGAAVSALIALCAKGRIDYSELVSYFEYLADTYSNDSDLLTMVADSSEYVCSDKIISAINGAYDRGVIYDFFIRKREFLSLAAREHSAEKIKACEYFCEERGRAEFIESWSKPETDSSPKPDIFCIYDEPTFSLAEALTEASDKNIEILARTNEIDESIFERGELEKALTEKLKDYEYFVRKMTELDPESYDLALKCAERDTPLELEEDGFIDHEYLGILLCFSDGRKKTILMPEEIKAFIGKYNADPRKKKREDSDMLIEYASAAVGLYGAVRFDKLTALLNSYAGSDFDEEYVKSLYAEYAEKIYVVADGEFLIHPWARKTPQMLKIKASNNEEAYIPDKEEFLRYSDFNYYEQNDGIERMRKYISSEYSYLEDKEIVALLSDLHDMAMGFSKCPSLSYLCEDNGIEFEDEDEERSFRREFLANVVDYTRLWTNKGFTNIELDKSAASMSEVRVKPQKIGRNDPCPCGSGKKYKKCCGR